MEDVFGDQSKDETPQGEPEVVVEQPVTEEPQEPEAGAPPAPGTDKHVPLAALEAERKGRQDWKEKALRLEGELKARDELRAATQPAAEAQQVDPIQAAEQRFMNFTLHASERAARKSYGDEVVDAAFQTFQEAAKNNPFLGQQALSSPDPWDYVVKEGQKLSLLKEIGDDPTAYREKLRQQLLAEQQPANPPAPRAQLPTSLANVRSVTTRSAPTYTGPPPLDSLFKN